MTYTTDSPVATAIHQSHGGDMGSRKRQHQCEPTTLMSLGDDMLAEILGRLPSHPSLARAAFACPRLHRVASSVANSRLVSPAPLLGYFVSPTDADIPSFHRALIRSDRDVAAIVRRSDFHLAEFEDYDWRVMDCRHGLLLLTSDRCLAVFDPVSGSRLRIPHYVRKGRRDGLSTSPSWFHCFLSDCADATASFRVHCLESTDGGRVRAHVFSSCTGEWCSKYPPARDEMKPTLYQPKHVGGRIYWGIRGKLLNSLDLGSMEFSHLALPVPGKLDDLSCAVGDTEDGTTCLVAFSTTGGKPHLQVWFLKEEEGSSLSSSSWEQQRRVDVSKWDLLRVGYRVAIVCDITAGIVLLGIGYQGHGLQYRAFRLSDTLQEGNTNRRPLFLADFFNSHGWVYPYFMAWPRPRVKAAGRIENASTSESVKEAAAGSNKKKQV